MNKIMVLLFIKSFLKAFLMVAMLRLLAWLLFNEIKETIRKEIKEAIEMNLQEFLNKNKVDGIQDEVAISKRLTNPETGELYKFKIRALTEKEYESARNEATTLPKKKKDRVKFDNALFNEKVIISACIYPNFKDAESIREAGCIAPEEYLHKVLLPGEISDLSNAITKLSGFDEDMEDLIDEAKN